MSTPAIWLKASLRIFNLLSNSKSFFVSYDVTVDWQISLTTLYKPLIWSLDYSISQADTIIFCCHYIIFYIINVVTTNLLDKEYVTELSIYAALNTT